MDKQRDIYRQDIFHLFKENFDSALFEEKHDRMMLDTDFESIRDDIEEDYFMKNQGIVPYTKAIKYLRKKVEACTATKSLFRPVEDYITAKDNITITKITPPKEKKKRLVKRKSKEPTGDEKESAQVHADCKSPYSCKKCRIMRRLDATELKPRKSRSKGKRSVIKEVKPSTAAPTKPVYSDISDSETVSTNSTDLPPMDTSDNDDCNGRLPYSDHQYSRISFYGTGSEEKATKPEKRADQTLIHKPVVVNSTDNSILKSKQPSNQLPVNVAFRFKHNNGLQQTTPAYYMQNIIQATRPPAVRTHTVFRPIPTLISAPVLANFRSPANIWPRSVFHPPVCYIQFCGPQQFNPQIYGNPRQ